MAVTDALAELVSSALSRAVEEGVIPGEGMPSPSFERPRQSEHGDWATNIALAAAKGRGKPRDIAQALVERLPGSDIVDRVEVAGPGFLNFYLSSAWLHDVVQRAADPASRFGRTDEGGGTKVNVEYVSSNPTGPINVVSGRHAAVGDALANLLEAIGHDVTREFYANDSGRQIELFARSISVRYLQQVGVEAELPEDGYQGEYISDIARTIRDEVGSSLVDSSDQERDEYMGARGLELMLEATRHSLERFGTRHDVWFRESTLHEKDEIQAALARLREQGWIEDREGASWFLSSKLGDDKDRVVVRADGKTTYLAADIAYLLDKFGRGFDRLIYLWGPDHHGAVPRLTAAVEALGFERDRVEIEIVQIVNLLREGITVRASKREGAIVPLDELVSDVGADAARYTFLTRSVDAPLDFDIELAKQQAPENPVYYVQYAHARICSIERKARQEGSIEVAGAKMDLLVHPSEDRLMRKLASYEEIIPEAARLRSPQRVTRFVEELASTFSAFYRDCQVISDDAELTKARLALCLATRSVIADGLGLLGVSAPERM
jgi:arginyl-tRNA synthetase